MMSSQTSPWVRGHRAPVHNEIAASGLRVEGAIPPTLRGELLYMSVSPVAPVGDQHQWFAGDGMVHAIDVGERGVGYRNRWVRTPSVSAALGETPVVDPIDGIDLANTSVIGFAGRRYALTETCTPYRLGAELETIGRHDFGHTACYTAHPHIDPATGELHGVGYPNDGSARCTYTIVGADHTTRYARNIELDAPVFMHDFALSSSWVVLYELPLTHRPELAAEGWKIPYRWDKTRPGRLGLISRENPDAPVQWIEIDPCYAFHTLNAHDDGRTIHIDVIRMDRAFDKDITGPGELYPPQLARWVVDTERLSVSQTITNPRVQEFPRIDPRFTARPHRFAYTVELFGSDGAEALLAHDLDAGTTREFRPGAGHHLSEALFVPDEVDASEGEGWLVGLDHHDRTTDLIVLDATDLSSGPVARVQLPQRVPAGFHGDWIPQVPW